MCSKNTYILLPKLLMKLVRFTADTDPIGHDVTTNMKVNYGVYEGLIPYR